MELLRQWALRVCVSCILAGTLELLLPAKGSARVIKTVLALYILVSVLAPVQKTDWGLLRRQLTETLRTGVSDTGSQADALVEQAALDALSSRLTLQLEQEGIEAQVEVTALEKEEQTAGTLQVLAALRDETQTEQAQEILRREMNGSGSILCRGMEGSS